MKANAEFVDEEKPISRRIFGWPAAPVIVTSIVLLVVLGGIAGYFAWFSHGSANSSIATGEPAVSQASQGTTAAPQAKLSPAEIKEMKARDDYAANLSKTLHLRLPAYKNVTIYADNWAGTHAPTRSAPVDVKSRTGDNLMLVFWSPDAGTARGLADFTKSRAVQEALAAGFAEFQFVDPGTYCYAQVAPVTGVSGVTCGIR